MAEGMRLGMKKFSNGKRKRNNEKLVIKVNTPPPILQKGDKVDTSRILFANRDFLIRNNGQPIYAQHLKDKCIVLLFFPLAPWSKYMRQSVDELVDIYNAKHLDPALEVVFIGFKVPKSQRSLQAEEEEEEEEEEQQQRTQSYREVFHEKFSIMPWTAIPFSYTTLSLNYWRRMLTHPIYPPGCIADTCPVSLVINPDGVVLQLGASGIFSTFGAEAYPFSDKMISYLDLQDKRALRRPSITQLLTYPGHEYLITCDNEKVPVKDLEDKHVALYLYEECRVSFKDFTETLQDAYDVLFQAGVDKFVVVLVYIDDSIDGLEYRSEESFRNTFHGMPWLALPYKHPRYKKLKRIFGGFALKPHPEPRLVIIGPHGNFVEPYGADIVTRFGVKACPFTRKEAVELEVDNITTLKLDMFLDPNTPSWFKDKLLQLAGKKIILIVEAGFCMVRPQFWRRMTKRYNLVKETGDSFEVIHIPSEDMSSSPTVPWLRCPPFPKNSDRRDVVCNVFGSFCGLIAFDGDGTVVRKTRNPQLQKGNLRFPFYDGDLKQEVLKDLIEDFKRDESVLVRGF